MSKIGRFLDGLKFQISGRSVKVLKIADTDSDGKVLSLQMIGKVRLRPNSLVDAWTPKAWEIDTNHPGFITIIDEKGNAENSRIVCSSGRTVDLYESSSPTGEQIEGRTADLFAVPNFKPGDRAPDREDILGRAATMDDIADSMDLGRSMRNILIGALVSAPLWWLLANLGH